MALKALAVLTVHADVVALALVFQPTTVGVLLGAVIVGEVILQVVAAFLIVQLCVSEVAVEALPPLGVILVALLR